MQEYLKTSEAVMADLQTADTGLTEEEAAARLEKNGKNKLDEGKKESLLHKFLKELADPMIIILIVAAAISAVTAYIGHTGEGYAGHPRRQAPYREK